MTLQLHHAAALQHHSSRHFLLGPALIAGWVGTVLAFLLAVR